jgi:murein DD-endopeptidase MepM/ murein hydrolase activator NlpD
MKNWVYNVYMKRLTVLSNLFLLPIFFILSTTTYALETNPNISISPKMIVQGDPVMVTILSTSTPTKIIFDGQNIPIFMYDGSSRGLIAIDINQKAGLYEVQVIFADGTKIIQPITVVPREKIEEPLGIPVKLGGNTQAAGVSLVSNLSKENTILKNIRTGTKTFWSKPFRGPLAVLSITDPYGYNRKTGEYTIPHKGTDFHAANGTKVYAMNRGVVRIARTFVVYGKTIVLDHGFGLNTLYMHLSKIYVNEGELVQRGQIIGLSGMTGYAEVPHLHLSVKINGISIDPEKFLGFFNVK